MASSAVAKTSVLSKDHHDRGEDKSAMTFLRIVISLAVALAKMYAQGVSTLKVKHITEGLWSAMPNAALSFAQPARQGPAFISMNGGDDVEVQALLRIVLRHERHLTQETPVLMTVVS